MPRPPALSKNGAPARKKPASAKNTEPDAPAEAADQPEEASATPEERTAFAAFQRRAQGREASVRAVQPQLFSINSKGELIQPTAEIPALGASSRLDVARWWFRSFLEQLNRPKNTIASYMYDLAGFEQFVGDKTLDKVTASDIAAYLATSLKKSTRKRRLTSLGAFYKYLIQTEKIVDRDPTDNFYADFVPLKMPIPLTHEEQSMLLKAAEGENSRTYLMIYFMLKLGFTRTELLAIQPEHVDLSDAQNPQIYVAYDDKRWQKKERKLTAAAQLTPVFKRYLDEFEPRRKLFEMLPQSVNKLVERVARDAGINKKVTPQLLRDTFAVEEARNGAGTGDLLKILGLAPDPRNRMSVDRYVKLAAAS
jgi:integrase/recombinase XerD